MIDNFNGYVAAEGVRKFRYRLIPEKKVFVNKRTPPGEPAEYFERKPYGGKKYFEPALKVTNGVVEECYHRVFNYDVKEWQFVVNENLKQLLFENGITIPTISRYGTIIRS
jgi:hypothetical protein